ncbi:hypothetical protein D3C87_1711560 [compost metagenome]
MKKSRIKRALGITLKVIAAIVVASALLVFVFQEEIKERVREKVSELSARTYAL